ncbi:MAG: hypothetical protein HN553_06510 [Opitutae bacterium]|nr:hypothetical protein [Opitutae bacterium]
MLLEENTWLKTKKQVPSAEILEKKKIVLPQLENSLDNLKKLKPEFFSPFDDTKKLVKDSHSKLLQIFYIDRENEDILLKLTQSTERQTFNRFTTSAEEITDIHSKLPNENLDAGSDEASDSVSPRS